MTALAGADQRLQISDVLMLEYTAPCNQTEISRHYEQHYRSRDPVWASPDLIRRHARLYPAHAKLQPLSCASDGLLLLAMACIDGTVLGIKRFAPDSSSPALNFKVGDLRCGNHSPTHGTHRQRCHPCAIPALLFEPDYLCANVVPPAPHVLFRTASHNMAYWGVCMYCTTFRKKGCTSKSKQYSGPASLVDVANWIAIANDDYDADSHTKYSDPNVMPALREDDQCVPAMVNLANKRKQPNESHAASTRKTRKTGHSPPEASSSHPQPTIGDEGERPVRRAGSKASEVSDGSSSEEEWQRVQASAVSSQTDVRSLSIPNTSRTLIRAPVPDQTTLPPLDEDVKIPVEDMKSATTPANALDTSIANLSNVQSTLRRLHTATQMKDLRIHQLQQALLASGHRPDLVIPQEYDIGLPARPLERLTAADEEAWRALHTAGPS